MQIRNHLNVSVEVLCETSSLRHKISDEPRNTTSSTNPFDFTCIAADVEPQAVYDVPLKIAYNSKLYIKPKVNGLVSVHRVKVTVNGSDVHRVKVTVNGSECASCKVKFNR